MKVGIVGSGLVGTSAAYALVMQGIGREIVLVDLDHRRTIAEAADIEHAVPFSNPLTIRAGDYADLTHSRVVIVAAGVNQKPGESRRDLLQRNANVFREVIPRVIEHAPGCVLLIATNPVDIMTHIAAEFATRRGIEIQRVIGSGSTLDTARFRTLLGAHFQVDSRHVHAHVIGEHGDSEVLTWSLATITGLHLEQYGEERGIAFGQSVRSEIDESVRRAAYRIIEGKGATHYGIGSALARITGTILHNHRSILTICSRIPDVAGVASVTISMPHLLSGEGVVASIPLTLDDAEQMALKASADLIKDSLDSLELVE